MSAQIKMLLSQWDKRIKDLKAERVTCADEASTTWYNGLITGHELAFDELNAAMKAGPMKTHRQHFAEILQTRDDPEGGSSDTARISHLLLFADMLDEREAEEKRAARDTLTRAAQQLRHGADIIDNEGLDGATDARETARELESLTRTPESNAFDEVLVQRLYDGPYLRGQISVQEGAGNAAGRLVMRGKASIQNILAELAKTPIELPTSRELGMAAHCTATMAGEPIGDSLDRKGQAVLDLVAACIVPMLAAKEARLAELQSKVEHAETDAEGLGHELNDAKKRIAELELHLAREKKFTELYELQRDKLRVSAADLEKKVASAERSVDWHRQQAIAATIELGHSGKTLEDAVCAARKAGEAGRERIAELEGQNKSLREASKTFSDAVVRAGERLKGLERQLAELEKQLGDTQGYPGAIARIAHDLFPGRAFDAGPHSVAEAVKKRVTDIEKRLAEAAKTPVDANGKTPGQTLLAEYERTVANGYDENERAEHAASKVLRAFGNGATVLQTVRKAIYDIPLNDESRNRYPIQIVDDAAKIIDAELAKLETPIGPNELRVHEFVCNENMIRGSYFWEGGLTDTYGGLQVERDSNEGIRISDGLQKQLKLNAGDIVEIRVLERADR